MKTKTRLILVAAVVLLALLGVLGYAFLAGRYRTEELSRAEVQKNPEAVGARYSLGFLSGAGGSPVANAYAVVGCWGNICTVEVEVCHEEGTIVDEVSLTFSPVMSDALFLKAPGGYPWPLAQFQKTRGGKGVVYSIPDAGFQGTGTMRFEFQIRKDVLGSVAAVEDEVRLQVDFTMHKDRMLGVAKLHAQGDIYLEVP